MGSGLRAAKGIDRTRQCSPLSPFSNPLRSHRLFTAQRFLFHFRAARSWHAVGVSKSSELSRVSAPTPQYQPGMPDGPRCNYLQASHATPVRGARCGIHLNVCKRLSLAATPAAESYFPGARRRSFSWAVIWLTASDCVWDGTANPYRSYSKSRPNPLGIGTPRERPVQNALLRVQLVMRPVPEERNVVDAR